MAHLDFVASRRLTEREIADILSVLSAAISRNMPFVAMGGSRAAQENKLVLASKSFLHLFGVQTLDSLSRAVSRGNEKSLWPLAQLAETLILDAAPRTKRLRFCIGSAEKTLTFLCRRVRAEGAPATVRWGGD